MCVSDGVCVSGCGVWVAVWVDMACGMQASFPSLPCLRSPTLPLPLSAPLTPLGSGNKGAKRRTGETRESLNWRVDMTERHGNRNTDG